MERTPPWLLLRQISEKRKKRAWDEKRYVLREELS
jgi:hypothetical protein